MKRRERKTRTRMTSPRLNIRVPRSGERKLRSNPGGRVVKRKRSSIRNAILRRVETVDAGDKINSRPSGTLWSIKKFSQHDATDGRMTLALLISMVI